MGWAGIVFIGAIVGLAGWRLHPSYRKSRLRAYAAVLVGVIAACAAKMAGNVTGLFYDGGVFEWPVCTAVALAAIAMTVAMAARR
jgi:hypothetical protein